VDLAEKTCGEQMGSFECYFLAVVLTSNGADSGSAAWTPTISSLIGAVDFRGRIVVQANTSYCGRRLPARLRVRPG